MSEDPGTSVVWRVRLASAVLLLSALAFHQTPGLVVPDTKLDLTANPGGFLARALHIWDPQGAFGQLQNQAYGYLFPVGPFHGVLHAIGVPGWITQRLWWSVVLAVAFLGFWRLSGALGVGRPWSRYFGGLLFALAPRMLGELAVTSVEVWPMAVAPWVLLPLVDPSPRTTAWRVSRSALAFACIGGVNAVASGAALVLPTLWLVTRRGVTAWRTLCVWLGAVVAVSIWWLGPLVLLGRYSPPFLDWIENADVTTAFASPFNAVSGTTTWLSFLSGPMGPSWPAGWEYVTSPTLIALAVVPVALGLAGLASRALPERTFLVLAALAGLVLVTMGHTGSPASASGGLLHAALDGPLAPLRNTHKFELVLRIPLLLAAVHGLELLARMVRRLGLARWLVPTLVASLLVALAAPAIVGRMARPEGYVALPAHWKQAAAWLDEQRGPGTVLVLPAAGFADFTWGSTKDEPLQALMRRPFAVRDAVPLGSAGTTRFLDGLEQRLSSGHGGKEVRAALRLAGVRYVVMRNDLRADAARNVGALVHQALAESGMRSPVASFGPRAGSPLESPDRTVDARTRLPYPSVEVFDAGAVDEAELIPGTAVVRAQGGAEDVARVLATVPRAQAVLTGTDAADAPALSNMPSVLTDGNQRREVFFGRAADNRSEVLAAADRGRTGRAVNNYVSDARAPQTSRVWEGNLKEVVASSSASDANATLRLGPGHGPSEVVDGHPETFWVSGHYGQTRGEWLELRFRKPQDVAGTVVRMPTSSALMARPTRLEVQTDAGRATTTVSARDSAEAVLNVPAGQTTRLRLTVTETVGPMNAGGVAIAEVAVPGSHGSSSLRLPSEAQVPDVVLMRRSSPSTPDCVHVAERPLCAPELGRSGEDELTLARELHLPASTRFTFRGTVTPVPRIAERLLTGLTPTTVTASSRAVEGAEGRPATVVDGDLGTGWVAAKGDVRPLLRLRLPKANRAGALQFLTDQYLAGARPVKVALSFDGNDELTRTVDEEGYVRWPQRTFTTLTIRFLEWSKTTSVDSLTGYPTALPVGVSEVRVPGMVNELRGSALSTGAPCGYGPEIQVDGRRVPTSVKGTVADVLKGRPLTWSLCGDGSGALRVPSGNVRLVGKASAEFSPQAITLTRVNGGTARMSNAATSSPEVTRRSATSMSLEVGNRAASSVLILPRNFNPGWVARYESGRKLVPLRVNGWQQGWTVPAGEAGAITVNFQPAGAYQALLLLGGLLCLFCLGAVVLSRKGRRLEPRPGEGSLATPVAAVGAGIIALVLMGGVVGAGVAIAAVIMGFAARGRPLSLIGVPPLLLVLAALWVSAAPWPVGNRGTTSVLAQVLVLVAISMACLSPLAPALRRRSPRRPRRITGRSSA